MLQEVKARYNAKLQGGPGWILTQQAQKNLDHLLIRKKAPSPTCNVDSKRCIKDTPKARSEKAVLETSDGRIFVGDFSKISEIKDMLGGKIKSKGKERGSPEKEYAEELETQLTQLRDQEQELDDLTQEIATTPPSPRIDRMLAQVEKEQENNEEQQAIVQSRLEEIAELGKITEGEESRIASQTKPKPAKKPPSRKEEPLAPSAIGTSKIPSGKVQELTQEVVKSFRECLKSRGK